MRLLDVDLAGGVDALQRADPRPPARARATLIDDLALPMPGRHNALNATAAIAVAHELGVADRRHPQGARRASAASSAASPAPANGTASTIFDDYGHHPVEIAAVLRAARGADHGQGHRGGPAASLHPAAIAVRRIRRLLQRRRHGHRRRRLSGRRGADRRRRQGRRWPPRSTPTATATRFALPSPDELAGIVRELAKPGDYVVCLGAGNITQWAYALPGELGARPESAA